jgi:formylglycine-generating enzyme required for sulfatase activity
VATDYPGLYDMSGNVLEWDASCDANGNDCQLRGGSYDGNVEPLALTCNSSYSGPANIRGPNIGFRCCGP